VSGRRLPAGEVERRREKLAPLFAYLRQHGINALWVAQRVGKRQGIAMTRARLSHIKHGRCLTPEGFVEECCREIGRSVEEVMGSEWVQAQIRGSE
jgi:hypothetical protein